MIIVPKVEVGIDNLATVLTPLRNQALKRRTLWTLWEYKNWLECAKEKSRWNIAQVPLIFCRRLIYTDAVHSIAHMLEPTLSETVTPETKPDEEDIAFILTMGTYNKILKDQRKYKSTKLWKLSMKDTTLSIISHTSIIPLEKTIQLMK